MEYPSNSHKFREEQKTLPKAPDNDRKVGKVVSASVGTRKRSEMHKLADIFISDDVKNVKDYLLMDVIVPTIKKALMSTLDMILNGGRTTYTDNNNGPLARVSYRSFYDDPRDRNRYSSEAQLARSRFDYDEITYNNRAEAEAVLREMRNTIARYGLVTVADLYDMCDLSQPYTSNKYGWINLDSAEPVRLRDGRYIIKLPKATPID